MTENVNINYNIRYDIEGIDNSIRTTQSLLLTLNAVRLSIKDIQMVMSGPTIANVMWTAIQLTRVYTNLRRLIRRVAAEQTALMGQTLLTQFGAGALQARQTGVLAALTGFVSAHPLLFGTIVGTLFIGSVASGIKAQQRKQRTHFEERNRMARKAQGLEN